MVIFTARQNLANLNEVKINLIVKFANLAGKSYIMPKIKQCMVIFGKGCVILVPFLYEH